MPQPEGGQLNFGFSPILTNVGISYIEGMTNQFIGTTIFPVVNTMSPVGLFNRWKADDFLRRNGKQIANYEAVPLGGFAGDQLPFAVTNWGVGTPWTNLDLANAVRGGTSVQRFKNLKTKWVTTQAMLEQEFRIAALVQTTANWGVTVTGVTSGATPGTTFVQWDQAASSPVDDILYLKNVIRLKTGLMPNTMVIPYLTWLSIRKNASLIDRIKYGGTMDRPTEVTLSQIKALFEIDNIVIPMGVYNSAGEGLAATFVDIWAQKQIWLGYVTADVSPDTPTAGYTFAWTGNTNFGLPSGMTDVVGPQMMGSVETEKGLFVREYPDLPKGAMIIEGMIWASPNVVAADLGLSMTGVIA